MSFLFRRPVLAWIVFLGLAAGPRLEAASDLRFLEGKYQGKYTAVLLISQGRKMTRIVAGGTIRASATATTAKITVDCANGDTKYQETITLAADGTAKVSVLIPGGNAPLNSPATGTYQVAGRTVSLKFPTPAGFSGNLTIRLGFVNANSALSISSVLALTRVEPFYTTVIGA